MKAIFALAWYFLVDLWIYPEWVWFDFLYYCRIALK